MQILFLLYIRNIYMLVYDIIMPCNIRWHALEAWALLEDVVEQHTAEMFYIDSFMSREKTVLEIRELARRVAGKFTGPLEDYRGMASVLSHYFFVLDKPVRDFKVASSQEHRYNIGFLRAVRGFSHQGRMLERMKEAEPADFFRQPCGLKGYSNIFMYMMENLAGNNGLSEVQKRLNRQQGRYVDRMGAMQAYIWSNECTSFLADTIGTYCGSVCNGRIACSTGQRFDAHIKDKLPGYYLG